MVIATELAFIWTEKLLEVTSAFARARTAREVGEAAVNVAVRALGARVGALGLITSDGKHVELLAVRGAPDAPPPRLVRTPIAAAGAGGLALRGSGAPVFVETREEVTRSGAAATGSLAVLPLGLGERVIGHLSLEFAEFVPIPSGARSFAQALAGQCAQALERARLVEAEEKARRRLKILADAAEAFAAPALATPAVLEAIARRVAAATGDDCIVRLLTPDGVWLEPRAWWVGDAEAGEALAAVFAGHRLRVDDGLEGEVVRTGRTAFVASGSAEAIAQRLPSDLGAWIRSARPVHGMVVAPLQLKRRTIGTLTVLRPLAGDPYDDEDRLLVEGLAARAASAIEKTRLYEEVLRSQRLFEGIADASPDMLYLFDVRRGRSVYVSRAVERILGRTPREVAALGDAFVATLVHPEDQGLIAHEYDRLAALPDGELVEYEYRMRHADGSWRWVRSRDRVFSRTPDGEPELVLGVARDVTERVRSDRERDELLAREQQARRQAEEASRAKDEFLAMLGHELRNPISPMLTALNLMRLRGGDAFARERTIVERQVKHLVRLVDDLLDVSRITRGKVELKREVLELGEVVATAIEMASPLLEARRHHVDVQVPPAGLLVEGDPDRLAQIVANLLTNAAKYTEPGGCVAVRAGREGGELVLRVKDSGMGVPPDLLPRIFDLFVQGQRALDRSQGGLGLGLTIVRSLVEMHGGRVRAESDGPGRGSTFTVRLPALQTLPLRVPAGGALFRRRLPEPGARRVLVVDDNQDAADALVEALGEKGHATAVAYDGPSALEAAMRVRPELAFLDIGLPVMDGYELARRLREIFGPGIKLVALTGYGQDKDRAAARAAGFDEHLVKPVDLERIVALVHDMVPAREAPGAAYAAQPAP
ncbi:MAG TPA: ATP-binding protein [Anaeromyxobacteraceae bacterium]|nr:ATP-binding protein [Anaeromyxobacteraceae bacterium]